MTGRLGACTLKCRQINQGTSPESDPICCNHRRWLWTIHRSRESTVCEIGDSLNKYICTYDIYKAYVYSSLHIWSSEAQKLHQVTHPQIPSAHRSHPASSQGYKPDSGAAGAQIYESVGIYLPVFGMENSVWLKVETMRKSLHTQGINQAVERGHLWWDVAICWARVTTPLEWHVILKKQRALQWSTQTNMLRVP